MQVQDYKHKVFIGSSKESLEAGIPQLVKEIVERESEVEVTIWDENVFSLNQSALEGVLRIADTFDFGIFIFSPDDRLTIRGKEKSTTRDNVVFEHGIFLGRMGPRRSFILVDKQVEHILSDYKGIHVSLFDSSSKLKLKESLTQGCGQIISAIHQGKSTSEFTAFPSTSLAVGYFENYIEKTIRSLVELEEVFLEDRLYKFSDFDINVIIPEELGQIHPIKLGRLIRKLKRITLPGNHKHSRALPLYISSVTELEAQKLEIIGIPEILFTSQSVADILLPEGAIGRNDSKRRMEFREIKNFHNTLSTLVAKNSFDEVNLIWMSDAKRIFN